MLAMFVGRLGALTVVLMIAGDDAPETIRYPKEDILVEILRDSHDEINTHTGDVLQNNWETIFANVKANEGKIRLLLDAGLEKFLLKSLNESPYFSTTNYSTALWNGLIFNAILFYAKSGFGDPIEAASSVQAAMQTMAEFVSAQHPK